MPRVRWRRDLGGVSARVRSDAEIRRKLESEITEPKCATCRELRDELVNARALALHLMERLKAASK